MSGITLVRSGQDKDIADRLSADLMRRGNSVQQCEPGTQMSLEVDRDPERSTILLWPGVDVGPRFVKDAAAAGISIILVVSNQVDLKPSLDPSLVRAIIRTTVAGADYDDVFANLFRSLQTPSPAWLDVYARPSVIEAPTGVSWWAEELLVADEYYGHLVALAPQTSNVLLAGLNEPHHIDVDRLKLLIANKGAHEVIRADLEMPVLGSLRVLHRVLGIPLRFPNGVDQAHGKTVIADTDNHRVLFTKDDLWLGTKPQWLSTDRRITMRYPCAVLSDENCIWVADTFNHRILAFDNDGFFLGEIGGYGWEGQLLAYPVGLATWRDFLLVADEASMRLLLFRKTLDSTDRVPLSLVNDRFGAPWVRMPFGLSVNRHGRLAAGDRSQRCIWLVDLELAIQDST